LPDPETITDAKKKKEAAAARARVDRELKQTELERGLNLFDQATVADLNGEAKLSADLLLDAKKVLDKMVGESASDPYSWKARAWVARIQLDIQSASDARKRLAAILNQAETPITTEGIRLARYFRMLVIRKSPDD